MKWLQQRQFDGMPDETTALRERIIDLQISIENEIFITDQMLGLLNAVYSWFQRNHPTAWAELPLGLQTRILATLGDIEENEIMYEQGEQTDD